jgi:hypothetical protein
MTDMNQEPEVSFQVLGELYQQASDFANWITLLDSATVALDIIKRLDAGFPHPTRLIDESWAAAASGDIANLGNTFTQCASLVGPYLNDEEEPKDLQGRPEFLSRAGFVVVETSEGSPLKRRVLKASTGLIDVFQYLGEYVDDPEHVAARLGEMPVATGGHIGPIQAWALERLVNVFRTLAAARPSEAVPRVRTLSRSGIDMFDLFFVDLVEAGEL